MKLIGKKVKCSHAESGVQRENGEELLVHLELEVFKKKPS